MDWFDTDGSEARKVYSLYPSPVRFIASSYMLISTKQIKSMNAAMRPGGRVLLRSAGLRPWYIEVFKQEGFKAKQVMGRTPGAYIDRLEPPLLQLLIVTHVGIMKDY